MANENDVRTDKVCQFCLHHTYQVFLLGKYICQNCGRAQKEIKDVKTELSKVD
jgi:ribosomal protein L37AE/L43A